MARKSGRHRAHKIAFAVLTVFAIAGLSPGRLLAHGTLKSSVPSKGAHLGVAPRELRLTFTERPELPFTRIQLLGPDSAVVLLGSLRLDSATTVVADIRGPLRAGTYTVVWQVASADGHPVRGRFSFTIAPGAAGLGAAPQALGEPGARVVAPDREAQAAEHHSAVSLPNGEGFGAGSPVYVAIRWLGFAALLVVLGAVAFYWVVLGVLRRRAPPDRTNAFVPLATTRSATLGAAASLVLALTAIARLLAQSYAMHGAAGMLDTGLVGSMVSSTVWGWGWLLQVAAVTVAFAGFFAARRGRIRGWTLAALGALALAFAPALSGHAASTPQLTGLAVVSDGLHILGAGGWLGSLLVVLVAGIPAALRTGGSSSGRAVADLVNAFSPTALAFAGLVAATGVIAASLHLGSVPALWQSGYGRTLLLKLAILSIVVATGAYNWRRVRPALGDGEGARRIRRSASAELAVGVLVLIVTAVLVAMPTPMEPAEMSAMR
ncbi:MAG: CopD family protein [Gemmatimonadota bacterium]|nr:CopD family protein [Gemmatimonadota bacterium]